MKNWRLGPFDLVGIPWYREHHTKFEASHTSTATERNNNKQQRRSKWLTVRFVWHLPPAPKAKLRQAQAPTVASTVGSGVRTPLRPLGTEAWGGQTPPALAVSLDAHPERRLARAVACVGHTMGGRVAAGSRAASATSTTAA